MELRALIRQMSTENQLWGAPRIHGELLKLGRRSISRREVHGETTWTSESGVENLPAKPRSRRCRHGSVRGPDHWLQTAVWLRDCTDCAEISSGSTSQPTRRRSGSHGSSPRLFLGRCPGLHDPGPGSMAP